MALRGGGALAEWGTMWCPGGPYGSVLLSGYSTSAGPGEWKGHQPPFPLALEVAVDEGILG